MRILKIFRLWMLVVLHTTVSHALVGDTVEQAIQRYGPPTGEIQQGVKQMKSYQTEKGTVTETYDAKGICIKSQTKDRSSKNKPSNYSPQQRSNTAPSVTKYDSVPSGRKSNPAPTPEEMYQVNVRNMWFLKEVSHDESRTKHMAPAGKKYCVLEIEVKNNSGHRFTVLPWKFHVIGEDQKAAQGIWCYRGNAFEPQELPPGTWSKGMVIFEVPLQKNYKLPELDRLTFEFANSRYVDATLPENHNVALLQ